MLLDVAAPTATLTPPATAAPGTRRCSSVDPAPITVALTVPPLNFTTLSCGDDGENPTPSKTASCPAASPPRMPVSVNAHVVPAMTTGFALLVPAAVATTTPPH